MTSTLEGGGWSAPRSGRFTPGKDPVPIVQEAGWAPGPVWTCAKNRAPTGIFFYLTLMLISFSLYCACSLFLYCACSLFLYCACSLFLYCACSFFLYCACSLFLYCACSFFLYCA